MSTVAGFATGSDMAGFAIGVANDGEIRDLVRELKPKSTLSRNAAGDGVAARFDRNHSIVSRANNLINKATPDGVSVVMMDIPDCANAELGTLARAYLSRKAPVVEVAKWTLRRFVTGDSQASHDQVVRGVWKRWGRSVRLSIEAYAYARVRLGLMCIGEDGTDSEQDEECVRVVMERHVAEFQGIAG